MGLNEPAAGIQRRERLPGHGGLELVMKGHQQGQDRRYSKPREHGGQGPQVKINTTCCLRFDQRGQEQRDVTSVEG